jgi:N-acetylmuramic acid 6-phosphate etherase
VVSYGHILGVEGGGTKTAWALVATAGCELSVIQRGRLPASNFRLTSTSDLRAILNQLPKAVDRVGLFLAGCGTADDRARLAAVAREVWPNAVVITGSDRESGYAAAFEHGDGIAVNAGTGSSVTGRRGDRIEQAGGWGHILGDVGGGYHVSLETLRLVLRNHDLHRRSTGLTSSVLNALALNSLDDLVRWAQTADKTEIAMLAPIVFAAAEQGDADVRAVLDRGARLLAQYTHAVATRLEMTAPEVKLLGGLFRHRSLYVDDFRRQLATLLPDSTVEVATQTADVGAGWLAAQAQSPSIRLPSAPQVTASAHVDVVTAATEQRNHRSEALDKLTARELVELFVSEERHVEEALRACADELARAIEMVADAFRQGGRLFYVGAGTSGRLGVLDASEIPPTFGVSADLVQGIIAGGSTALHRSVEGAEDDRANGALAIRQRSVSARDVVCGIAASGRTPFVLGALERAKSAGARTMLLTCNPARQRGSDTVDLAIDLPTGPELLTGSTRLKAGTATKIALNILTTGAMVQLGKVRSNLMIDVTASNSKLRDRAARLVAQLAACDYADAVGRLERNGWNVRKAISANSQGS